MSRMDRYYDNDYSEKKRSRINQDLYRSIYETDEYSNIEGIATMDKTNEIDLSKIKNMLKSREDYNSQKQYRQLFQKGEEAKETSKEEAKTEEKNYDIRDVLEKVKSQKQEDEKYRSIDNTNYNILKELKIQDRKRKIEDNTDEIKELINTMTNTGVLNKLDDAELSLSMLDDLKASEHTISNSASIKKILEDAKAEKEKENTMSNSFYTKSLNFGKKDMEDYVGSKEDRRRKRGIKLIVIFIVTLVLTSIGFMLYKFIF